MQMNPCRDGRKLSQFHTRLRRVRMIESNGTKIKKSLRSIYRLTNACNCCSMPEANHRQWQKYPRKHSLRDHRN